MANAAMSDEMAISVESMKTSRPKPAEGFSVLVVDGDSACLAMLSRILCSLGYKVLTAKRGSEALYIAQEKEDDLHVVLTGVHLPDMNKYELLDKMRTVSNLPVVIMSDDDDVNTMLGCLFKGAVFYIVKPLTMNRLKNLWQFAFTKKRNVVIDITKKESNVHVESQAEIPNAKRKRSEGMDKYEERDGDDYSIALTKPRLIWTTELHHRFLRAVRLLGIDDARPKKILQHMNVPGLRKRSVSSHLQKYRLSFRREQAAIEKKRIRDSKLESSQSYQSSSTFNLQGGVSQFPNMYYTPTTDQPEYRSHFPEDLRSQMSTRPAFGSEDIPIHVDSSSNETSNNKYGQQIPSNQLDYAYFNAEHFATESSNNKDLAAGFGYVESFFREDSFHYQNKNFSSVNAYGQQNLTDFSVLLHSPIQQEEQQQPSPLELMPSPPLQEQEENDIFGLLEPNILLSPLLISQEQEQHETFGFERAESDELFHFAEEGTTQLFHDVDFDDFC